MFSKKRDSQIFRLCRAFFIEEVLKTVKNPLKLLRTVNFFEIFPKNWQIFEKRDPKNFFQESPGILGPFPLTGYGYTGIGGAPW